LYCLHCTACIVLPVLQVVEKLYRQSWTRLDGLGALVLTPTRELAMQIFEELVKVRKKLVVVTAAWHCDYSSRGGHQQQQEQQQQSS
jgi:superfamily II DNA/RNA helicase